MEAPHVRIFHQLRVVIINKTVEQNVEIRQGGAGHESHDEECAGAIQPGQSPREPRGRRLRSFPDLGRRRRSRPASCRPAPTSRPARQTEYPRPSFSPGNLHASRQYTTARQQNARVKTLDVTSRVTRVRARRGHSLPAVAGQPPALWRRSGRSPSRLGTGAEPRTGGPRPCIDSQVQSGRYCQRHPN